MTSKELKEHQIILDDITTVGFMLQEFEKFRVFEETDIKAIRKTDNKEIFKTTRQIFVLNTETSEVMAWEDFKQYRDFYFVDMLIDGNIVKINFFDIWATGIHILNTLPM